MPTSKTSTGSERSKAAIRSIQSSVDRLDESLGAAEKALTSLRSDVGGGAHDMVEDVERLIESARRDASKLSRAVREDLAELAQAMSPRRGGPAPKPAARKPAARKPRTRKPAAGTPARKPARRKAGSPA